MTFIITAKLSVKLSKPNTFVFFINNLDALHGVSMRGVTNYSRNFFYFAGIYGSNLFEVNQYKSGFINKMQLKLKEFFLIKKFYK